ncbi:DNA polymerase [Sporomusaceae bacterium FL31]|nr:DNA polymerase [Sporomusaceae bacterium FL31]GCE35714.1 DNA polymerase [Sporomusaceae bacterium]
MLLFDLEANGLLETITKIHCVTISKVNVTPEELYSLPPEELIERFKAGIKTKYRPDEVPEALKRIQKALNYGEPICGHNIINYDTEAMHKVYPEFFKVLREQCHLVYDTLVLSRLIYSNIKDLDAPLLRSGKLPGKLYGSHSLRAWGHRLGVLKGDFALHTEEDEDMWAIFTEEMLEYNFQDVVVTEHLAGRIFSKKYSEIAIRLEHEIQWLMCQQQRNGFPFDTAKALVLEEVLRVRLEELKAVLMDAAPPIPDKDFIPKRDNKKMGYVAGQAVKRFKKFNPNSRQMLEYIITKHYKYRPEEPDLYNVSDELKQQCSSEEELMYAILRMGLPLKIDETTFNFIKEDPEAPEELQQLAVLFEEYFTVTKRIGQLVDGKQGWLKNVKEDGNIHGSVNPNGAVTGRATHSSPNIAQVPKVQFGGDKQPLKGSEGKYGYDCRELFTVPEGWYQAGVDASGLELRCLAHFLYPYDSGYYAEAVVFGDVHTLNQEAAGLPTRDNAKTFIYAWLYGAGDAKIGKIVKGDKLVGKRLKAAFLSKNPAIANLKKAIETALVAEMYRGRVRKWRKKWLKGLDGRQLHVRYLHAALNTLLQSAGALICKKWLVETERILVEEKGLAHGWDGDFCICAWVHDEFQAACRSEEIAKVVVETAQEAMRRTQEFFGFRVQLDTDGKIGKNWAECH